MSKRGTTGPRLDLAGDLALEVAARRELFTLFERSNVGGTRRQAARTSRECSVRYVVMSAVGDSHRIVPGPAAPAISNS